MLSVVNRKAPVKARIVHRNQTSCLVASFETGANPLVWQLDLEKNPNFLLSLKEKEGEWDLGYAALKEPFTVVAHFDDREEAEAAFRTIHNLLTRKSVKAPLWSLFKALLLAVVLFFLLWFAFDWLYSSMTAQSPQTAESSFHGDIPGENQQAVPDPHKLQTGVPTNADDVLPKNVQ